MFDGTSDALFNLLVEELTPTVPIAPVVRTVEIEKYASDEDSSGGLETNSNLILGNEDDSATNLATAITPLLLATLSMIF